jgi:CxxC-x17-CxxC domain-containing protein
VSGSDVTLVCRDCNNRFVFTAGEQQYYATHGLAHQPTRCPNCRAQRKTAQSAGGELPGGQRAPREMYQVVCSSCGRETEVPFQPTAGKPVYCRDCYEDHRGGRVYGSPAGYRSSTRF